MAPKKGDTHAPIATRLWRRVKIGEPDECWEWMGARKDKLPYGLIMRGPKGAGLVYTHRVAYEVTYGPVPDGLLVLHKCDNPPCCNPRHLFLGTHQDNTLDAQTKGRRPTRKGKK